MNFLCFFIKTQNKSICSLKPNLTTHIANMPLRRGGQRPQSKDIMSKDKLLKAVSGI